MFICKTLENLLECRLGDRVALDCPCRFKLFNQAKDRPDRLVEPLNPQAHIVAIVLNQLYPRECLTEASNTLVKIRLGKHFSVLLRHVRLPFDSCLDLFDNRIVKLSANCQLKYALIIVVLLHKLPNVFLLH